MSQKRITFVQTKHDRAGIKRHRPTTAFSVWLLRVLMLAFVFFAVTTDRGYPVMMTISGLLLIWNWQYFQSFVWPLVMLGVGLIWMSVRSDFDPMSLASLQPKDLEHITVLKLWMQAVFYIPVVLAAWRCGGFQSKQVLKWLFWPITLFSAWMLITSLDRATLYQGLSRLLDRPIRPDLAMVEASLGTYALLLVFWPLAMIFHYHQDKLKLRLMCLTLIVAPILMSANAVTLALILSASVFYIAHKWPKNWGGIEKLVGVFCGLVIFLFPLFINFLHQKGYLAHLDPRIPASWADRLGIWDRATQRMFTQPFEGLGFDYSRNFDQVPMHPHNMAIQMGLELGFMGISVLALFWVNLFERIGEGNDQELWVHSLYSLNTKPFMLAAATSYFVLGFLSFSLWQEWFLALGAFSVVIALLAKRSVEYDILSHIKL